MFFGNLLVCVLVKHKKVWEVVLRWLRQIGKEKAAMLRHVYIEINEGLDKIPEGQSLARVARKHLKAPLQKLAEAGLKVDMKGVLQFRRSHSRRSGWSRAGE